MKFPICAAAGFALVACSTRAGMRDSFRAPVTGTRAPQLRAASPNAQAASPNAQAASAARPPVLSSTFTRVLDVQINEIALGDGTRIAALGEVPYVGDARGLRPLPLPSNLRAKEGESDRVDIFFGRDNEPRIMGSRLSPGHERPIYFRHYPGGWRDGREEIGPLGGPSEGGLWGVLGGADPELVCRANAVCIIKRTRGWTIVPAGPTARTVTLQDGALWGLDQRGIWSIDSHGWSLALEAPSSAVPRAFWATGNNAWIATQNLLFEYRDHERITYPSPVGEVLSIWGLAPNSVWVAGTEGAAHYDGDRFWVLEIRGPLRMVRGRTDDEVWFGGDAGLYRRLPSR